MAADENRSLIGSVPKGLTQALNVYVGDYQSRAYVYLRLIRDKGDNQGPVQFGLSLRPDCLRELIPVLQAALEAAESREAEASAVVRRGAGKRSR